MSILEHIVGRGWDAPNPPDLEAARAALAPPQDPWTAAGVGDVQALERLLGADDANAKGGPRDWEPLLYAAFSHAEQIGGDPLGCVKLLLERGADPDAHYFAEGQDNGFSALYGSIAVSQDRERTKALLAAGASPSDGNSTFHAVESFDLELMRLLAEAGIEHEDASTTIKHAIDMGFGGAIRLLLDLGADPDALHPARGESTLHWAVMRNASLEVIGWLMDAGANPDLPNHAGQSPMEYAARFGYLTAMERMGGRPPKDAPLYAVARGELVDFALIEDQHHDMLATWAQHGRQEAVEVACAMGFPLDSTAWMGLTAVHWAALRGDPRMLKTLLDAGAPVVDLGGYFGTPQDVATNCRWYAGDYEAVLALLKDHRPR